jgi:hypothetical protein
LFRHLIEDKDENECVRALKILGFDKNLVLSGFVTFGFVFQSDSVIDLRIEEQTTGNLNEQTRIAIM